MKSKKKVVKAWATLNKKGKFMLAELRKIESDVVLGSGEIAIRPDYSIVRCTITYSLPSPRRKK